MDFFDEERRLDKSQGIFGGIAVMGFARFRTRNTVVSRVSARTHLQLPVPGYTTNTLQLGG
jgi:hypothetical protein